MEDAAFSDEFCRFLRAAVPTVDADEVLLLLHRDPERWFYRLMVDSRPGSVALRREGAVQTLEGPVEQLDTMPRV